MQCSSCGHERPRSGNCPHCGTTMAGGTSGGGPSSLRGWREQAGSSGSSRPSRPNTDDQRPISRPVSGDPSRSRASGTEWGSPNQSASRRGGDPNQSYPRRDGDPNRSFARRGGFDDGNGPPDERGLMLPPDAGGLMSQMDDRALPALPTEEEERALGIRRPAFIPATDERKGKKPGRWRVISGVASIMLFCVASCGVSGVLLQKNLLSRFSGLIGFNVPTSITAPVIAIPTIYAAGKPLVTPVPGAKTPIQTVGSYTFVIAGSGPVTGKDPTDIFKVGYSMYILVSTTTQVKVGDILSIHWTFNGLDVTSDLIRTKSDCCAAPVHHDNVGIQGDFIFVAPTTGYGRADIYYNTTWAYSVLFYEVEPGQTPTPFPTATPTVQVTPTLVPTATKHP